MVQNWPLGCTWIGKALGEAKYRYYMKVDKKSQEGFGEKYKMNKNDKFDDLKGSQPGKSLKSN